ncbi:MAG: DUF934 domain-containing protein [Cycloclasticus sp.]
MTLIRHKEIVQDDWHYLQDGQSLKPSHNIVSLDYWLENKTRLINEKKPLGLTIPGHEEVDNFVDDLQYFSLIAIEFPTFTDGRGYSLAKTLREHYRYQKEIRASGDILPDQALYLTRVGFDALELANEELAPLVLNKLDEFSVFYQPHYTSK